MAARVRMLRRYGAMLSRLSTPAWLKVVGWLLLLLLLLGRLLLETHTHEFLRYWLTRELNVSDLKRHRAVGTG